jgi:predicted O-linked N-acetylglucosamine transferase (SPINDLY family)
VSVKPGRNDPCPCGSGKKYKKCCQDKDSAESLVKNTAPTPDECKQLVALFNAGRYAELESRARLLVEQYPDSGFVWKALGVALHSQGKNSLQASQKAAELRPDDADAHSNLGNALRGLGQFDGAVASYRRALVVKPDFADAHNNLGNALRDLGQLDAAAASYRRALAIEPDFAEAHNNLGNALRDLGRLEGAVASYRRALAIKPDYTDAHSNLGNALRDLGRLEDAVASYRRALAIKPDFADAHRNLGAALRDLGQVDEAVASYHRALAIKPDYAEAHGNLGYALQTIGRLDEAMASYRRALEIKSDYADAHNNLGNILRDIGQPDDAEASYRRALAIKPDYAEAYNNLGNALLDLRRLDEAEASYRLALTVKPDYARAHSNLLYCLSQSEAVDAQALFAEHRRFAEQFEAPLRASWPQHPHSRSPERCLQVGFVSGDLRTHPVAFFIEPVLAHLSGYPQLSLHAYYNQIAEDGVTQRLRGYLPHWHPIASLSDDALAQKIRADGIDILIDLSGHTAEHRLLAFARKPAPVQASWIGYPGTTGLSAMDYYLADRFFLPPGQFDSQFTEKIVQMPASAPFLHFENAPPVNALPALSNGHVTFGSFNRANKLNRPVVALWSQLLRALPDSRMLLGGMPRDGGYGTLIEWFAQEGIARERLSFHPRSGMEHYLELHHQVDICLDTFPYTGGTTTLHALWMGVPTLTMTGNTVASRTGATILSHAGLEAFVAHDAADFVQRGLSWSRNLAALSDIRAGVRERFAKSVMGQPALVAAGVERALRLMWQRWCAGLPPESFEVTLQDTDRMTQEAGK